VGIVVDENKHVTYDARTHQLVDSRPSNNPVTQSPLGFEVVSLFRRVKSHSKSADGNPLIYALKSVSGYSIDQDEILAMMPDFRAILGKLPPTFTADFVVPIPSGSSVSSMFARRVARSMALDVKSQWISKKYNQDICRDIDRLLHAAAIPQQHQRAIKSARANLGRSLFSVFSMKLLEANIRHLFDPFKLAREAQLPAAGTVLLVDDLLSTGSSLASAKRLFEAQGLQVKCLCLFSATGPYKLFR
jgi:hypothetical protein